MNFDHSLEQKTKIKKSVELPSVSAVTVKITMYKRGSKQSDQENDDMFKHHLAALLQQQSQLRSFATNFGPNSELEQQLAKDKALKEKIAKRRSERAAKLSEIDPILKENLSSSKPWVPSGNLKFCEPAEKNIDSKIDQHQQLIVSKCINFLGIYNNTKK
jgi:hypothetical protein